MKGRTGDIIMHIVLPLVAGFFIYYYLRPDVVFVRWFTNRPPLMPVKEMHPALKWLVLSGPDFCWSYSLASAFYIWERWQGNRRRFFPLIVTGVLVLAEVLQVVLPTGFTFDRMDLVAAIAAAMLSTLLLHKKVLEC